jgi:DHA2 family multidrug resistance protein
LFVWRELVIEQPAVDLSLMRNYNFASGVLISGVLGMGLYSSMFLLPIFLQQLLGYSALDSGITMMPRSIAMGVALACAGRLYNRLGARLLVGGGLLSTAASFFLMTRLSLDSGYWDLLYPQLLQGFGLGMTFVSVSTSAMASLERSQIMAASGLYNVFRQVFGSIGVAIAATLFTSGQNSNRALLVEHTSSYNSLANDWLDRVTGALSSRSPDLLTARAMAEQLMDNMIMRQAAMLSCNRIFALLVLLFVFSFPLLFLLRKGNSIAAVEIAGE